MKTMQTHDSKTSLLLILLVMLLSVVIFFSFMTIAEKAFANGDTVSKHNGICNLTLDEMNDIELNAGEYTYADFYCVTDTTYVYTVTGTNNKVATKVFTYDKAQELTPDIINTNVYSVDLEKDTIYKIAFISHQTEKVQVCLKEKQKAFKWSIDGNIITENTINLIRGKSYSVSFFINGHFSSVNLSSINNQAYNYSFDYNLLNIASDCMIEGKGFELKAEQANGLCLDTITVIPKFNEDIKLNGTYDFGSERGLYFEYQKGISQISYRVQYQNAIKECMLEAIDGIALKDLQDRQIYKLDVVETLKSIEGKQGNAQVGITGVKLATADNTSVDFEIVERIEAVPLSITWVGSGTESNPYQVSSIAHFNDIESKDGSGVNFIQTQDLDFNFSPTTRNVRFDGNYNGNLMDITNIKITSSTPLYDGGLFDRNTGTIHNIGYLSVEMNYSHWGYVGGMVGGNTGAIFTPKYGFYPTIKVNCIDDAFVAIVGGVAGVNQSNGWIYVQGAITINIQSNANIGGIVGQNNSSSYIVGVSNNFQNDLTLYKRKINGTIVYTCFSEYAQNVGGIISDFDNGFMNYIECNVAITAYSDSSHVIKPRIGGFFGIMKSSGASYGANCYCYSTVNPYNFYESQLFYVDFNQDYIGEIIS